MNHIILTMLTHDVIFKLAFDKVTHYINYLHSYITMAFMNG